jgi:hypothetical protein
MSYQSAIADLEQIISDAATTAAPVTNLTDGYNKIDVTQLIALAKDTIAQTAGNKQYNNLFKLARIVGGSSINKLDALFANTDNLYYANISPNISDNQKTNIITFGFKDNAGIKLFHFKHNKEKNIILNGKIQLISHSINIINSIETPAYNLSISDADIQYMLGTISPQQGEY